MANHTKEQTELTLARIVELADYQRMIRHLYCRPVLR